MTLERVTILLFILFSFVHGRGTSSHQFSFVKLGSNGVTPTSLYTYEDEKTVYSISPLIKIGTRTYSSAKINTNGYIVFNNEFYGRPSRPFDMYSGFNYVIAPFWDYQYIGNSGHVKFELHNSDYSSRLSQQLRTKVGYYIQNVLGKYVSVDALLVVEWSGMVASSYKYRSSEETKTNKFQALITSSSNGDSYAIFTYRCGELQWSKMPTIGFIADDYMFRNHPFSLNRSSPNPIACVNYPQNVWSNVVYKIDNYASQCYGSQFGCSSGRCVSGSDKCDGYSDCTDGTDEVGCSFVSCYDDQFTCRSGGCVSSSMECDGRRDCSDGSDESDCSTISAGAIGGILSAAMTVTLVFCVIIAVSITYQVKQRMRRRAQFRRLQSQISVRNQPTPSTQTVYFHPKPGEWYQTVEGHWVQGPPPVYAPSDDEGNPHAVEEGVAPNGPGDVAEHSSPEMTELHIEGMFQPTTDQTPPTTDQTPPTVTPSDNSSRVEEMAAVDEVGGSDEVGGATEEGNPLEADSSDSSLIENENTPLMDS